MKLELTFSLDMFLKDKKIIILYLMVLRTVEVMGSGVTRLLDTVRPGASSSGSSLDPASSWSRGLAWPLIGCD